MKTCLRQVPIAFLLVAVLALVSLCRTLDVRAEDKGLAQQVQGTWTLVSIYNETAGKKSEVFGSNPRGSLIFTPNGRFSLINMKASLPKFAAKSRVKGTAEENQAVVQGSVAMFGSYAADSEKKDGLKWRVEGCTFPNFDGEEQKRIITVSGDEMTVVTPAAGIGGTNYAVYKRAK